MGSPIHHGASSVPSTPKEAFWGGPGSALLQRFERLSANRFEEVNNYSDRLTRRFRNARMTTKVAVGNGLGALGACRNQRRHGLAAPPRAGATHDQSGHDRRGAAPERRAGADEAYDQERRAAQRRKFVGTKAVPEADAD
jgi:hypothetical protein